MREAGPHLSLSLSLSLRVCIVLTLTLLSALFSMLGLKRLGGPPRTSEHPLHVVKYPFTIRIQDPIAAVPPARKKNGKSTLHLTKSGELQTETTCKKIYPVLRETTN